MLSLRLSWRLLRGSGRAGLTRLGLVVLALGIGVAAVLVAWTLPSVVHHRAERAAARLPAPSQSAAGTALRAVVIEDSRSDRLWTRVLLAPTGPDRPASLPPGLSRLPGPGETIASPALARAAAGSPLVRQRLGRVVGTVTPDGLTGPDDQISYTGLRPDQLPAGSTAVAGWGGAVKDASGQQNPTAIAAELLLLLGGPALLFLAACSRLNAATRAKRLAALRLAGLNRREFLTVAAVEAAATGVLGAAVGLFVFALLDPVLGRSGWFGLTWFSSDSTAGPLLAVAVLIAVPAVAARVAVAGSRRILADPTATRAGAAKPHPGWWRLLPLVAGLGVLIAVAVQQAASTTPTVGTGVVNVIAVGAVLATIGLVVGLQPITLTAADRLAERTRRLPVRLGARRLQIEPGSAIRVISGLVLLLLVAGIGSALLQDAKIAAGGGSTSYVVEVPAASIPTVRSRAEVLTLPARGRLALVHSLVPADPGTGKSDLELFGAFELRASCTDLAIFLGQRPAGCTDNTRYRLIDPDAGLPALPADQQLTFPTARPGQTTTVTIPPATLPIPGASNSLGLPNALLDTTTEPPAGGWPDNTTFRITLNAGDHGLDRFQAALYAVAPAAQAQLANTNLSALETYRVQRGTITLGLVIGFTIALLAFLVAATDRALERRRAVATLVVVGTPTATLRAAQAVQLLLPLTAGVALAVGVAELAASTYLIAGGDQTGPSAGPLRWSAFMVPLSLAAALGSSRIVLGRRLRTEELRRE